MVRLPWVVSVVNGGFYERHGFVEVDRTDGSNNEDRSPDIQYVYAGR